jgi:deazaflavin-dependent oxidoreductase (nitroreductase family)
MDRLTGSDGARGVPTLRLAATVRRLGNTQIGARVIKYLVAPLDRWLYRLTGGRILSTGHPIGPILLLTTTGRRTGKPHTTPVFYLRDGERLIICNVNPGFEHENPWTLNLRAHPVARVQVGRDVTTYRARVAAEQEVERYWSHLVDIWPTYQVYYARGGQRVLFVLEPAY